MTKCIRSVTEDTGSSSWRSKWSTTFIPGLSTVLKGFSVSNVPCLGPNLGAGGLVPPTGER